METDNAGASETQSTHSLTFNFADADVIFQSSDRVLFHVHTVNLDFGSDGFPPTAIRPEKDEIINLQEDSETLDLLFRFVCPRLLPDFGGLEFDALAKISEAVEKYQVHMGRKQCNLYMAQQVRRHPLLVFNYAVKHNYPKLANSAAPNVRLWELGDKITRISRESLDLWLPYYYRWTEIVRTTTERYTAKDIHEVQDQNSGQFSAGRGPIRCNRWLGLQRNILAALVTVPGPDWTIWQKITISETSPQCCLNEATKWRNELATKLKAMQLKELPPSIET